MSFATKRAKKGKKQPSQTSSLLPQGSTIHDNTPVVLRTSRQVKAAYNRRTVPLVTTRGIHGTYTFLPRKHAEDAQTSHPSRSPSPGHASGAEPDDQEQGLTSDFTAILPPSSHLRKRERQSFNWTSRVIPELLPLYHHLLRTTQSLSRFQPLASPACTCGSATVKTITVLCLYFDCEFISIPIFITYTDRLP